MSEPSPDTTLDRERAEPEKAKAPEPPEPKNVFLSLDRDSGGLTSYSFDEDIELLVDGALLAAGISDFKTMRSDRINRFIDADSDGDVLHWKLGDTSDSMEVGRNVSPDWTLENGNTLFLPGRAGPGEEPVTATFVCPADGADLRVAAGETYTFQCYFGLHRANGTVRLQFRSAAGEDIKTHEIAIAARAEGGRRLASYLHRHLTVTAPEGAATLRVEIVKGVTEAGERDSFLFFTRPSLIRAAIAVGYEHLRHDLPADLAAEAFTRSEPTVYSRRIPLFDQVLDGNPHKVTLHHRPTGDTATVPVFLPASAAITAQIFGLEGSTLVARAETRNPISVALWVDGQPAGLTQESEAGSGNLRFPLPLAVCDGNPHLIELRRSLTGQVLGQYACIGPISITPWDALQRYARMPLPSQLSALAGYRYRSLASDVATNPVRGTLPLTELHDILLEGFERPRRDFRVLPFQRVAEPDVSIVIPVHNKFDVTYVCLAAILFAANKATYEVIVVDDGSTDSTTLLPEIAPGVVYVRNDVALGFVGACNAGAAEARGRYVFFLNNDTEPTAHFLDELIFAFDNFEDVGLAGSKLIYPDGALQEAGGIVWGSGDPWNYGRRANAYDPRFSYSRVCDYVSGAAIMLPRALWEEVGGFSKEFMPAYFEDTDLAFKVKAAGKKVVYVPHSVVVHYEGMSNGTDQTASSGLKRFQEINRPKFKRKWASLFANNGKVGDQVDLAKDRGVSKRVVFFDYEVPHMDRDAGSYAAIQEIRMFQAMGCKVTYVPLNMAYLGRHTDFLQRIGVEVIYVPFSAGVASFMQARGKEFDLVYITRYGVGEQVLGLVGEHAPQAKVVMNVADLHFLRQIRDAIADNSKDKMAAALRTREAEIASLSRAELILSYSSVEQTVISSHITHGPKAGIVPWVIDAVPLRKTFAERRDIAFMGGFNHYPNVNAVKYFITEVMPLLRAALPGVRFLIYGSNVPADIEARASEDVVIKGYVADVAEIFDNCRVFVAPLLTGAGMKGKVLDCVAAGIPSVLSPIAAEGIGLRDGMDTIVARKPPEWVEAIGRIYNDEAAWNAMSLNVHSLARKLYSFEAGVQAMSDALSSIEFYGQEGAGLCVTSARPKSPRHLPERIAADHVAALPVQAAKKAG